MQTEIEAKFTDIDKDLMRERLRKIGATLVHAERLMRRKTFCHPTEKNAWIRVRDEGDKVTMTYKRVTGEGLHGTQEINLIVDRFEQGVQLLEALGLKAKSMQETLRETWEWKGCEIEIDTWPWIPSILEIEGPGEEAVRVAASALGFDWNQAKFGPLAPIYQKYFSVTEDEVNRWPTIAFTPVPEWLEKVRRAPSV